MNWNYCQVKQAEPGTLMYLIHLQAPEVLDAENNPIEPPPPPIPLEKQKEVIFLEIYEDEVAFSRHVNGNVFQSFLKEYVKYFKPNTKRTGWPITNNEMFDRLAGCFIRERLFRNKM